MENLWDAGQYFADLWTGDPDLYLRPGGADIGLFTTVPGPGTYALIGLGLAALAALRRRR